MTLDLFDCFSEIDSSPQTLAEGAWVLSKFAAAPAPQILNELSKIFQLAPLRQMITPGGFQMSVAMTNCGTFGWISDTTGYRYSGCNPQTGQIWPPIPNGWLAVAQQAAAQVGYHNFLPNACLINYYRAGTKLSLHQDKDERDFSQPIVSISFGVSAVFLFGGVRRNDKTQRILLSHGDAVVWGGPARLCYHGILPVSDQFSHPELGESRINLSFRYVEQ